MKKIFFVLFLGLSLLLSPSLVGANVDPETWEYLFHLQYKDGKLAPDSSLSPIDLYNSVPEEYKPEFSPAETDFYGKVVSGKGKELARFGFNKPTTIVPALGKSLMNVFGPKFANADHVAFYDRAEKHLFNISVKGSSFCNDNNKCDTNVGENHHYCPNDCPPLPGDTPASPAPEPVTPLTQKIVLPPSTPEDPLVGVVGTTAPSNTNPTAESGSNTTRSVAVTALALTLILGAVLLWRKKNITA